MRTSPATAKHLKWLVGWLVTVLAAVVVVVAVVAVVRVARRFGGMFGPMETLQISRGSAQKKPVLKQAPMKPRVFGGVAASVDRYPYYCFFTKPNNNRPFCGGVLIAPNLIMSAAHCNLTARDNVYIGGPIGGPLTEKRAIKTVTPQPGLDICVVRLQTPSTKQPIKMATREPPNGSPVVVMGRGRKGMSGEADHAFTLARLTYADPRTAETLVTREGTIKALEPLTRTRAIGLAYSPDVKGGCLGDSGGPVIIARDSPGKDELLGIISFGPITNREVCDAALTKNKYTFFFSIPFYQATRQKALEAIQKVHKAKCKLVDRFGGGKCPRTHPWDTRIADGVFLGFGYTHLQCAETRSCAQLMANFFTTVGARLKSSSE